MEKVSHSSLSSTYLIAFPVDYPDVYDLPDALDSGDIDHDDLAVLNLFLSGNIERSAILKGPVSHLTALLALMTTYL